MSKITIKELSKFIFDRKEENIYNLLHDLKEEYGIRNSNKIFDYFRRNNDNLSRNSKRLFIYISNKDTKRFTDSQREEYKIFCNMTFEEFSTYNSTKKIQTKEVSDIKNTSVNELRMKKFVILYTQGKSYDEIAEEFGISTSTLKTIITSYLPRLTDQYIEYLIYQNNLLPLDEGEIKNLYDYLDENYSKLLLSEYKYYSNYFNVIKRAYEKALSLFDYKYINFTKSELSVFNEEIQEKLIYLAKINKIRNKISDNNHMSDSKKEIAIKKYDLSLNIKK